MQTELITPSEAKAMFPLMDESNFVGALWDPVEGHLDPSGTTHAYAKAARTLGAEVVLRNPVKELTQEPDGTWNVVTEQGTVKASMSSMPAGCGRARSAAWSGWSCRCSPWSTCTC
jgi:dimethylglycine dehydrogenase